MSRIEFESRDVKGVCGNHGDYEAVETKLGNRWLGVGCPACLEESKKANEIEAIERRRLEAIECLIKNCGVSGRYINCTLDTYIPANEKAVKIHEALKRYVGDFKRHRTAGTSIFMVGSVGTGKTHLGASMVLEIINKYVMKAHFTTITKMLRRVRATYQRDASENEDMVIDYYASRDILVIDEIGVQSGSDHEHNTIFEIINERYADMKPTIILSNLGLNEIRAILGERIVDRFKDGGAVFSFDWESHRGSSKDIDK